VNVVKTTVILDDDVYRRLVEEAIERYGSTRTLSRLINEKLREGRAVIKRGKRSTIRLGRELREGEIKKMIEEGWEEATRWKR
jgi:hypothetical protein